MNNKIINLTDDTFDNYVIQTKGLILVDFWAEWCGPCKILLKILDEIIEEFINKVTITKLNIDQNPKTALKYGIKSIPTLLFLNNKKIITTKIGLISKEELKNIIVKINTKK
ncbi:Thioredoxin-1 [Serratia symbiotica]|nr:Thioredoxin-1 [Serratia symbiotica]